MGETRLRRPYQEGFFDIEIFSSALIILLVEEAYSFVSKPPFILHIAVCG